MKGRVFNKRSGRTGKQEQDLGSTHRKPRGDPRLQAVNRQQMAWRAVDVEQLIAEDHRARAIWQLVGKSIVAKYRIANIVMPDGLVPLKVLDKYSYCTFTKRWLP